MTTRTIYTLGPLEWPAAAALLERAPRASSGIASRFDAEALVALAHARLRVILASPNTLAWAAGPGGSEGFAAMTLLPWDSEQLGMGAARLDYLAASGAFEEQRETMRELLACACDAAHALGVRHLSTRVDASDIGALHVLEAFGFCTVDSILTFARDLDAVPPEPRTTPFRVRPGTPDDAERAADLARRAYKFDRFHSDPAVPRHIADELHAEWVRNSCAGRAADAVILAEDEGGLLGYATCKIQRDAAEHLGHPIGTIVLVATHERARGRGVGRATTEAALNWFATEGCAVVEVGTQLRNLPASRLYARCGFTLAGASVSLRKII